MAVPDPAARRAKSAVSDAELLTSWREGDSEAGEALFIRHYATVSRFFRNKVAADRVADLVQDTFIACVEGRDRILNPGRFRSYLLTVAYRTFCRHVREHHRREEADLDVASVAELGTSISSVIGRAQEQRLLLEALRAIPINYQVVLELHYWEGLTTNEIAEVLELPSGTARSRLRRARDALEAAMGRLARSPELLHSTLTRLDDWAEGCGQELGDPKPPGGV